jgi:hypothetical protein
MACSKNKFEFIIGFLCEPEAVAHQKRALFKKSPDLHLHGAKYGKRTSLVQY